MVALNNGVIQNKDGRSFDRSTGTWEEPNDETPNQNAEKKQTDAKPPKPRVIQYNIDGKKVYISSNDWQHFQELRAQLASGTTLNDDLIEKMKSILAEAHW